jgi:hypothetical protein
MLPIQRAFFAFITVILVFAQKTALASKSQVYVNHDLADSQVWDDGSVYLIAAEVHVLAGVTLTIADGVELRIINGRQLDSPLGSNALVFDTGSALIAQSLRVRAADLDGDPVAEADNGGIWFLGSWRTASKDGIEVTRIGAAHRSRYTAQSIKTSYLGRSDKDPTRRNYPGDDDDAEFGDDIDGISILGMGRSEWRVSSMSSVGSGDDGFDVTNSNITLDGLRIDNPTEDGMNISSSVVEIKGHLKIDMTRSKAPDRGLFDLEVDDGPSRVIMAEKSDAELSGYFGDELVIESSDMPMPTLGRFFRYSGLMKSGTTEIYLNDEMNPQTLGSVNSGQ